MKTSKTDITIIGGGLAGLSLAYQLTRNNPELSIVVIERNNFPIPNTTAKVGESTVEIASHYFTHTLGLGEHFKESHLVKHGLRCFFGTPQNDFSQQDELGVSRLFGVPSYQLDRGVTENHLHKLITERGVRVIDGATTDCLELGNQKQSIKVSNDNICEKIESRWLIDAAGRQKLLSKKLGLHKDSEHKGNAVWFRVNRRVIIDDWSDNPEWHDRIESKGSRWLSTNHLTGPGYWVWVIPLGTGTTSFGIVMDDQAFEEANINSFEDALKWLRANQPKCAQSLEGAEVMDFCQLRDYSYGCKKMFSNEGWCLTGEAAAFTDPFYSPGSDFIAINNTFINELISAQSKGKDIRADSYAFHLFYDSFFQSTLSLYTHEYGGFGDRRMMGVKLLWDYSYYWGVLALIFFKQTFVNIKLFASLNSLLDEARQLNTLVQNHLIERAKKRIVLPAEGIFLNQRLIPCLGEFVETLQQSDTVDIHPTLDKNVQTLRRLSRYITNMLQDSPTSAISEDEQSLLGDYRKLIVA